MLQLIGHQGSVHALAGQDIEAFCVRSGHTEVILGDDARFDRALYERFEHARFARVFTPIWDDGNVVGTIQAGCA